MNEPLAFITFIAAHPLGSEVAGTVTEFSSHGAFVDADGARCYLPLSAMGDPPPRRAREVVSKGEELTFVVQALDPQRRGVELALPGFAHIAGGPTEETVEAEIHEKAAPPKRPREKASAAGGRVGDTAPDRLAAALSADEPARRPVEASAKKPARAKKGAATPELAAIAGTAEPDAAAKKAPAAKKSTAKASPGQDWGGLEGGGSRRSRR